MVGAVQLVFAAVTVAALAGQAVAGYLCATANWGRPIEGEYVLLPPEQVPAGVSTYLVHIRLPIGCDAVGMRFDVCDHLAPKIEVLNRNTVMVHRATGANVNEPLTLRPAMQCIPVVPHHTTTTPLPWFTGNPLPSDW